MSNLCPNSSSCQNELKFNKHYNRVSNKNKYSSSSLNDPNKYCNDIIANNFVILNQIGKGSFGEVYLAYDLRENKEVAIKKEKKKLNKMNYLPQLKNESKVYQSLLNIKNSQDITGSISLDQDSVQGISKFYGMGELANEYYLIMDFLGPNLLDLLKYVNVKKFTISTTCLIAIQIINRIEYLHNENYIHRDIKPENFLIGTYKFTNIIYMIDFGLSKRYKNSKYHQHIPYREGRNLVGTARYVSVNTHLGIEQSRRDDLESIGYLLVFFMKGVLPWQGIKGDNKYDKILEKKLQIPAEILCNKLPEEISLYLNYVKRLRFEDRPDYEFIKGLFVKCLTNTCIKYCIDKEYLVFDWTFENPKQIWKFYKNKNEEEAKNYINVDYCDKSKNSNKVLCNVDYKYMININSSSKTLKKDNEKKNIEDNIDNRKNEENESPSKSNIESNKFGPDGEVNSKNDKEEFTKSNENNPNVSSFDNSCDPSNEIKNELNKNKNIAQQLSNNSNIEDINDENKNVKIINNETSSKEAKKEILNLNNDCEIDKNGTLNKTNNAIYENKDKVHDSLISKDNDSDGSEDTIEETFIPCTYDKYVNDQINKFINEPESIIDYKIDGFIKKLFQKSMNQCENKVSDLNKISSISNSNNPVNQKNYACNIKYPEEKNTQQIYNMANLKLDHNFINKKDGSPKNCKICSNAFEGIKSKNIQYNVKNIKNTSKNSNPVASSTKQNFNTNNATSGIDEIKKNKSNKKFITTKIKDSNCLQSPERDVFIDSMINKDESVKEGPMVVVTKDYKEASNLKTDGTNKMISQSKSDFKDDEASYNNASICINNNCNSNIENNYNSMTNSNLNSNANISRKSDFLKSDLSANDVSLLTLNNKKYNKEFEEKNKRCTRKSVQNINIHDSITKQISNNLCLNHENDKEIKFSKKNLIQIKREPLFKYYLIQSDIGQGSYGKVKRVRHKKLGEERAMKIIYKKGDAAKNEIEILRRISHPNIMNIYEIFEDSKKYYIITEYLDGGELFDFITNKGSFCESDAAMLMKQVLQGINYLHSNGIVHRDIKPENIMLVSKPNSAKKYTIKIIDFGTAIEKEPGKKIHKFIGTSYYIAPEVIEKNYDEKCDIWSCGVILYILLCGYPPFNGSSNVDIFHNIQYSQPLFNEEWKDISPSAMDLIKQMLDKSPESRYSAEKCLSHKWFKDNEQNDPFGLCGYKKSTQLKVVDKMSCFVKENKFKQAVLQFIATQFDIKKEEEQLREIFRQFDVEGTGQITKKNFYKELSKLYGEEEAREKTVKIFNTLDLDGNGDISYNEFLTSTIDTKKVITNERLEKAFKLFDKDGNGKLSIDEIKSVFGGNNKQWRDIIHEVDLNDDGEVDFEEFKQLMVGEKAKNLLEQL